MTEEFGQRPRAYDDGHAGWKELVSVNRSYAFDYTAVGMKLSTLLIP